MRLSHFFEGKLGREEVASAILAMALEGIPRFRNHFFKLVAPDEYNSLSQQQWSVKVEVRQVDVRMETEDTIVLIENKISAGAKQTNQLLRYYLRERKHNPKTRLILVYLAPGQIGKDEIERVTDSSEFKGRADDLVQHLSWETLAQYSSQDENIQDIILRNGLDEIQRVIDEARLQKYSREGERGILCDIVKRALIKISEKTNVSLMGPWAGRENEQIYTSSTNITMWLDSLFKAETEPPYAPINLCDDKGLFRFTIRSQFKLAGKVNKDIKEWWRQQAQAKFMDIPGVGTHYLQEDGWLVHSQAISGSEEAIEKGLVDTGVAVLGELSKKLSSAGFTLAK